MKSFPAPLRTGVPTGTFFSKSFLASVPPFNSATQTNAADFDAAAALFAGFERSVNGGVSGILAMCRTIQKMGTLPESVVVLNPTNQEK